MYHISNDKRSKTSALFMYEALMILLKQKNLTHITVSDVVKQAQIGRTTFYRCFDSIEDILQYQSDLTFEECGKYMYHMVVVERMNKPEETFLKIFLEFWSSHYTIIEILIAIDRADIIHRSFKHMLSQFKALYPEINIPYYNYFVEIRTAIAVTLLVQWIKDDRKVSPSQLIGVFKDQILLDHILYDSIVNLISRSH